MLNERTIQNRIVFDDAAKPKILRKGKPNYSYIYEHDFVPAFNKKELQYKVISLKTFYKYIERYIDPDELTSAQQGRVALKHAQNTKLGHYFTEGFLSRAEADCLHEPIALLDPSSFKPTGVRPIHYLAYETHTSCYLATVTDYVNGSELSAYVIELYKQVLFPKYYFQSRYGTKYRFRPYGFPFLMFHDGGSAYIAGEVQYYFELMKTCSGLAKTQDAKGKPFVESGNCKIKENFSCHLDGYYDDKQKVYIDPKHYSKFAVLTTLEHEILFNRYICDQHNNGFDKPRKFNRGEQWIREYNEFPPPQPNDPLGLISFLGMTDNKTIQVAVGIQFHVRGDTRTFNSTALQKLRRVLKHRKMSTIVTFHFSDFFAEFIKVVNPIEDSLLIVPLIKDWEETEILYKGDEEFYAQFRSAQNIKYLSSLTNEEIIEGSRKRKRMIERYKKEKKKALKEDTKSVDAVMAEDIEVINQALAQLSIEDIANVDESHEPSVHVDNNQNTSNTDLDWEDDIEFN